MNDFSKLDKNKLIIFSIILILNFLMLILNLYYINEVHDNFVKTIEKEAVSYSEIMEGNITSQIKTIDMVLENISYNVTNCEKTNCNIESALSIFGEKLTGVQAIFVTDKDGVIHHSYSNRLNFKFKNENLNDRLYFLHAKENYKIIKKDLIFSKPQVGKLTKNWEVNMSKVITSSNDEFLGIVVASISLEDIKSLLKNDNLSARSAVSIRNQNMEIIARYPEDKPNSLVNIGTISKKLQSLLDSKATKGVYSAITPLDGIERVVAFKKSTEYPIFVNVGLSVEDYLLSFHKEKNKMMLYNIFFVLFSFVVLYLLIKIYNSKINEINKRELVEKNLITENQKNKILFNNATEGIHILDSKGLLIDANTKFYDILGYSKEELLNKNVSFWDAKYSIGIIQNDILPKALLSEKETVIETIHKTKEGKLINVEITMNKFFIDDNIFLYASSRNIDQRKKNELELELYRKKLELLVDEKTHDLCLAKKEADIANIAKTNFLANMSHEIRTPLNVILGMSFLLKKSNIDKNQKAKLNKIEIASEHLLGIINSVLDLSKIESGKFSLEEEIVDIQEIIDDVKLLLIEQAQSKNLDLIIENKSNKNKFLGDKIRIKQILLNYVMNAIKFTNQGNVKIIFEQLKDNITNSTIKLSVKDSGVGIEKDAVKKIFKAFEQADNSITRKYGGTGLGLAINKKLANLMNGDVGLETEINKGSVFWATLNLKNVNAENSFKTQEDINYEESLKNYFNDKNILVVEDEEINREIVSELLKDIFVNIDYAENGMEAIKKHSEKYFDLILMDMQMPLMSGIDATKNIREKDKKVSIIALTANAFSEDKEECLKAGMNDFISKPIEPNLLFKSLFLNLSKVKH